MPYEIKSVKDSSIIVVHHTGDVTIEELTRLASEVRHRITVDDLKGVLVDSRSVESVPNKADYLAMLRNRSDNPYLELRVAILFGDIAAELADFASLATQNRGGVAWEFSDEAQAVQWLREQTGLSG